MNPSSTAILLEKVKLRAKATLTREALELGGTADFNVEAIVDCACLDMVELYVERGLVAHLQSSQNVTEELYIKVAATTKRSALAQLLRLLNCKWLADKLAPIEYKVVPTETTTKHYNVCPHVSGSDLHYAFLAGKV